MDTVVVVFIWGVMPREKNGRVYVQSIGMIKLASETEEQKKNGYWIMSSFPFGCVLIKVLYQGII